MQSAFDVPSEHAAQDLHHPLKKKKEIFETLFIFWVLSLSVILQVIDAANEVVGSIDRDELAKYFSLKSDPEDEEAEVCFFVTTFP